MPTQEIDRAWIASEIVKMADAERSLVTEATARGGSPPIPELTVLYHEIADQDGKHVVILDTIAARYGQTPSRSVTGGVGEALGRIKDKVTSIGASPLDLVRQDLATKTDASQWIGAWASALELAGDSESAADLNAIVAEDQAHQQALVSALKHMIEQHYSSPPSKA